MKKTAILLCVLFLIYLNSTAQHNTYYIGHSGFGWDLMVGEMVNYLVADAGINTYDYNFQFIGGTCISNQWESHATPQGGTDSHIELPTGNYDILVLAEQIPISEVIYSSPWGCTLRSVAVVDSFYDMAVSTNPDTRIYLMEYHNEVDQTAPNPFQDWSALNTSNRPLWEQVADSVSLINNGPDVCIVPVAAAFEALADSVRAGVYPGDTNWINIFDPNDTIVATIHPTEQTYYLVACVHYAVIFGQSPVGLTNQTFAAAGWGYDTPSVAQATMMQEIAWEIVSNDAYACLPDSIPDTTTHTMQEVEELTLRINQSSSMIEITTLQNEYKNVQIYNIMGQLVYFNS